jgi:bifunctional polynucleotide phosphatase/kinase
MAFVYNSIIFPEASSMIAAFDLDDTLIRPKSGNVFPRDYDDWVLISGVAKHLQTLFDNNYKIVVFTNQGGKNFDLELFEKKLQNIITQIGVPMQVFISTKDDIYRKPRTGMWNMLFDNNKMFIDMDSSFYIGDMAGIHGSDLKFARNIGIKFYADISMKLVTTIPKHPLSDQKHGKYVCKMSDSQEIVILVGPPASGKSSWCTQLDPKRYVICCQDTLVTKAKLLKLVEDSLKNGKSVVIDRKNEYLEDRMLFKKYNVPTRILYFNVPREISEHMCMYRQLTTGKIIPTIVYNKYYSKTKGLQIPGDDEAPTIIDFMIDDSIVVDTKLMYSYLL